MRYWMTLLSALTGGLSLFRLAHKTWNFGLAPLMQQFLEYYRALLHPVVEFIVGIVWWVAAIPFVSSMVQAVIYYWTHFWNATLVYVMKLLLPVEWFSWISSRYYMFTTSVFEMPADIYRDLFILSFVVTAPAFRAGVAFDQGFGVPKVIPTMNIGATVLVMFLSTVVSLPLVGLATPLFFLLLALIEPYGRWAFFISYFLQFFAIVLTAAGYFALNGQG